MKKLLAMLAAVFALVTLLTACDRNVGKKDTTEPSQPVAAAVKTGLATVSSVAISDDALTDKTVVAAVAIGEGGKLTACKLDEIETDAKLNNGKITREKDVRSKYEQGYDYGLASADSTKKEWFEQVDALCDYVIGKTAAEVAEIPLENGVATDEMLRARCNLSITAFLEAIGKACDSAAERGAQANDALALAVTAESAPDSTDKAVHTAVQLAAVTLNSRGVVTDCLVDESGKKVEVKDGAFFGETGTYRSKRGQKEGMEDTTDTDTVADWSRSSRAFEEYVIGKTAAQVKATPLTDGKPAADTDLAEKCTIRVTEMMNNVLKAIDRASETDTTKTTATATATATATGSLLDDAADLADDAGDLVGDAADRAGDAIDRAGDAVDNALNGER